MSVLPNRTFKNINWIWKGSCRSLEYFD